jgi:DNA adenine methylase
MSAQALLFPPDAQDAHAAWRWAGGKRWLLAAHASLLPDPRTVRRLGLPFVGGGSVAFYYGARMTRGTEMLISDTNRDMITTYLVLRDNVGSLVQALADIASRGYGREQYDRIRERFNKERDNHPVYRAAWFIVLLCWNVNGIWRTNKRGEYNVPFGKPSQPGTVPPLPDADTLRACSLALRHAIIADMDFEEQVRRGRPAAGDFWYFDSPYVPMSATGNFTAYTADGFSMADQERLAAQLPFVDAAGARFALSNSDTRQSRELYEGHGWDITPLQRPGTMSSDAEGRQPVGEILVRNLRRYP